MKRYTFKLAVLVAVVAVTLLVMSQVALAAGDAQVIVELQQNSPSGVTYPDSFAEQKIAGTNTGTKEEYKFQRQREGGHFSYVLANLDPSTAYKVELSFVEHEFSSSGKRAFNVYLQNIKVLNRLDIYSRVGKDCAYQRTFTTLSDTDGRLDIVLRSDESGGKNYATVSTIRVYRGSSTNVVEIDASRSRQNPFFVYENSVSPPVRRTDSGSQNTRETVLGRMGSRTVLNLLPQRLAWRFSSLGDGTGDLSDLVLAVNDGLETRCLPFTDRYPVWESISQSQTMTSQSYECASPQTDFEMDVTFRSPFYPGDEKVSGAPFFYVDVTVKNAGGTPASGDVILAWPSRRDFSFSVPTEFSTTTEEGLEYTTRYPYFDETFGNCNCETAREAIAVPAGEAAGVDFRGSAEAEFTDFSGDRLWGYTSPGGYPDTYNDYKSPTFTYYPRGYFGAVWSVAGLAPGESVTRHFVVAGYVADNVLKVKNSEYEDDTFKFKYTKQFADVQEVVNYAVTSRWTGDMIEDKSLFFDSTISSDSNLTLSSAYRDDVRGLIAYSFKSFLMNTWWAESDSGREWFSVWEGSCCRFHSTVDVEYNDAWFYFSYWPELLEKTMDEWVLYLKSSRQGTYLSHDMGWNYDCSGQAYPHDMGVEENTDFILLLYKYWKSTGNTAYMRGKFPLVRKLIDFIINCDDNNNGLPDQYTWNTLDQSTPALQFSKDQTYLGVKCLSAHQAAREMALNQSVPDLTYEKKCHGQVELINQTLAYDLWLSDHFAVCLDGNVEAADREAYSIYPSNGLLYLLGGGRSTGVTSGNMERFRTDIVNSTDKTMKKYGCTHSTYNAYNQWVSQNLWRDQVACYLGVQLRSENPLALTGRYWDLQKYFARNMNGSFWDVLIYPGGSGGSGGSGTLEESGSCRQPAPLDGSGAGSPADGGARPGTVRAESSSYGQSLGYYPRGAVSLGLLEAVAGIALDRGANALYYQPTTYPLRVPILSCADWGNADPAARIPTMYFTGASSPPAVTNGGLLPSTVAPREMRDVSNVEVGGHAISPNQDGVNDSVTVSYTLPLPSNVARSVWGGKDRARSLGAESQGAGVHSFAWDGRADDGSVVADGIYTARIDALASDDKYAIRPASAPVYVNSSIPDLSADWYLAEGFTGHNETGGEFEEYVLIQNPDPAEAAIDVTFMLSGGETVERSYRLAPNSRFTITVDDILPDAEVSTHVHSDRNIAVERAMYFNERKAGHASIGVSAPSEIWYLAEGYTAEHFDEFVLIQNPGDAEAEITATFMVQEADNVTEEYSVGPHSRFTIHVVDIIPGHSVSTMIESDQPVVVERAQYLNYMTAGHCSIGATSPSRTWYLAEGYTDQGFEEWVLIQNPQDSYNNITVTLMESTGENMVRNYLLPPECRFTMLIDELLPASEVSIKVCSENPVLVERAMYWNDRSDGHDCIGTPTPDSEWYLAEGYTDGGFETWILVQNPGYEQRNVTFTFMEPSGVNMTKEYQVAPRSRFTVGVDEILPASEFSTRVSADGPIIVERAIYFNDRSGGTDSLGIRGY
ncbi:MAG: DUF4965 domain-containing protein [Actinobacteria bacterium]|nr:DUF4965 domain-containing protein [Actinomycetota bacterium]